MTETIKRMLSGAGDLVDVTGHKGTEELRKMRKELRSGVGKYGVSMKRHFDKAYTRIK